MMTMKDFDPVKISFIDHKPKDIKYSNDSSIKISNSNDKIELEKSKVGDLILFPNYLMHTAYPFVVDGERRSFSFNIELDKKVADVFHD